MGRRTPRLARCRFAGGRSCGDGPPWPATWSGFRIRGGKRAHIRYRRAAQDGNRDHPETEPERFGPCFLVAFDLAFAALKFRALFLGLPALEECLCLFMTVISMNKYSRSASVPAVFSVRLGDARRLLCCP